MDATRICLKCMKNRTSPYGPCSNCGFDPSAYKRPEGALAEQTILQGRYMTGVVLSKPKYAFRYSAMDLKTSQSVIVTEFFQPGIMRRSSDGASVAYRQDARRLFQMKRERFARISNELANAQPQGYARVTDSFKANHTWYMIQQSGGGKAFPDSFFRQTLNSMAVQTTSVGDAVVLLEPDYYRRRQREQDANLTSRVTEQPNYQDLPASVPYPEQQPYGQDSYGQDPYGQDPYGQDPYGQAPYPEYTPDQGSFGSEVKPKKRTGLIIGLIALAVVVAAGVIGLIIWLNHNKKKDDETETTTTASATPTPTPTPSPTSDTAPVVIETETVPTPTTVPQATPLPDDGSDRNTMMLYLVGANLESQGGLGSAKIKEIVDQHIDTDRNNILIYTGGANSWVGDYDIPYDRGCIWRVTGGYDEIECVYESDGRENTGEKETLTHFLQFCYDNYPAQQYSLVFWDHGGGPEYGFGQDELFYGDGLTMTEMKDAMAASPFSSDNKLSWVAFDACLMASLEVADIFDDYADYMIASEEIMPGAGMQYGFIQEFDKGTAGRDVIVRAAECYMESLKEISEEDESGWYNPALTISCLDLSFTDEVLNAVDSFAQTAQGQLDAGQFAKVASLRGKTKRFALAASNGRWSGYDLVDLGDMADVFGRDSVFSQDMDTLKSALNSFVYYKDQNVDRTSGAMIYFPYDNENDYFQQGGREIFEEVACTDNFENMLTRMMEKKENEKSAADWGMDRYSAGSGTVELTLNDKEMEDFFFGTYTVFLDVSEGGTARYVPVLYDMEVQPDENGVLRVDTNQKLTYMKGYEDDGSRTSKDLVIPVKQLEDLGNTEYFCSENIRVQTSEGGLINQYADVSVNYFQEENSDDVTVQNVSMQESSDLDDLFTSGGRNEVKLDEWDTMAYSLVVYTPTYENGHILRYGRWEEEDEPYTAGAMDLEEDIEVHQVNTSETSNKYVVQIVVEDVYGWTHGSEVISLN